MKKLILPSLLFIVCNSVMAEWSLVDNDDKKGVTTYIDFSTLQRTKNKIKVWVLHDYKKVRNTIGIKNLSYKLLNEYDCTEKRMMKHLQYIYSDNMGNGEKIELGGERCCWWSHVLPGTINESIWKLACKR